jgi:hypothetical protein
MDHDLCYLILFHEVCEGRSMSAWSRRLSSSLSSPSRLSRSVSKVSFTNAFAFPLDGNGF